MQSDAPSSAPANRSSVRRTLLIIGGAEDRIGRSVVLKRFIKLAGGRRSHIVVIPTASSYAGEVSEAYRDVFTRLRGGDVSVVHPETRRDSNDPAMVEALDTATGVFLTGGSQVKLAQNIVGTPVGDAIVRAYERGAVVAGTSAGASIMSRFMISLGRGGPDAQAAGEPDLRGPRPRRGRHRRPALRPARTLRPAHVDGGRVAQPARHGHRREHRSRDP